jgi:hypothetical protein
MVYFDNVDSVFFNKFMKNLRKEKLQYILRLVG